MFEGTADKALLGGMFGMSLLRSGNPIAAAMSAPVTAAAFASPTDKLKERKSSQSRLLTTGIMSPQVMRGNPNMNYMGKSGQEAKSPSPGPNPSTPDPKKTLFTPPIPASTPRVSLPSSFTPRGDSLFEQSRGFMQKGSMQKSAGFWSGLKNLVTRPVEQASRGPFLPSVTKRVIRKPIVAAGIIAGATAGLMGADYLQNQFKTVDRSRSYRNMMKEYGPEITAIAAQDTDTPVPEKEIRNAFNALYTLAPDIAKDPTLAAAQMAPIIREIGTVQGYLDPAQTKPRVMMEHGLTPFMEPSKLQGGIPRDKQISDYALGAASLGKGLSGLAQMLQDEPEVNLEAERILARTRAEGQADATSYRRQQELAAQQAQAQQQFALDRYLSQAKAMGSQDVAGNPYQNAYMQSMGREQGSAHAFYASPQVRGHSAWDAQIKAQAQEAVRARLAALNTHYGGGSGI